MTRRKLLLTVFTVILCATGLARPAFAQTTPPGPEGTWKGTLAAGPAKLRLVLQISKTPDGLYLGTLDSVDQGAKIPIDLIEVNGDQVKLELKSVQGTFEGSMNSEKTQMKGTWTQLGRPLPLEFTRTGSAEDAATPPESTKPPKPAPNPLGIPIDLDVPIAPTPFDGGGKTHLAYELHITNFSGGELVLNRLDIVGDGAPLASFEGAELNSLLFRPAAADAVDKRAIGPGLRAIAYLWITLDSGARVPASIHHRITVGDQSLEAVAIAIPATKPVVLGPPLRGADWIAVNGPSNSSIHRRALIPIAGKARIAQRFGIDWVQMVDNGSTFSGDREDNKSYRAYGSEVLAVADGLVVAAKDGIPENFPGLTSRAVPITLETIGGNHIILDLGGGQFAFYAHLQPGSLRVKTGDRVRRGHVLAKVGNSGNSTEPHLHFHVSNANSPLGSEGLPFALESFEVLEGSEPERRQNALPLQNTRVRFQQSP